MAVGDMAIPNCPLSLLCFSIHFSHTWRSFLQRLPVSQSSQFHFTNKITFCLWFMLRPCINSASFYKEDGLKLSADVLKMRNLRAQTVQKKINTLRKSCKKGQQIALLVSIMLPYYSPYPQSVTADSMISTRGRDPCNHHCNEYRALSEHQYCLCMGTANSACTGLGVIEEGGTDEPYRDTSIFRSTTSTWLVIATNPACSLFNALRWPG